MNLSLVEKNDYYRLLVNATRSSLLFNREHTFNLRLQGWLERALLYADLSVWQRSTFNRMWTEANNNKAFPLYTEFHWLKSYKDFCGHVNIPFIPAPPVASNLYYQMMYDYQKKRSRREQSLLLTAELYQRHNEGWYTVFNTLTVSPECYTTIFPGGNLSDTVYFKRYIQSLKRLATRVTGLPDNQCFRYWTCGEISPNGRLHFHQILMFKDIPDSWKVDPNNRCNGGNKREIDALKPYWKFGFSSPCAIRTGVNDVYSRLGWSLPCNPKTGKIACMSLERVVNYVTGYLTKNIGGNKQWKIQIRIRKSQSLGKDFLQRMVNQLAPYTKNLPQLTRTLNHLLTPSCSLTIQTLKRLIRQNLTKQITSLQQDELFVNSTRRIMKRSMPLSMNLILLTRRFNLRNAGKPYRFPEVDRTHVFNLMCDYQDILQIAKRRNAEFADRIGSELELPRHYHALVSFPILARPSPHAICR